MIFALTLVAVLAVAILAAGRRHGRRGARNAAFLAALWVGFAGCARPYAGSWHVLVACGAALVLLLSLLIRPRPSAPEGKRRSAVLAALSIGAWGVVIPLGAAELAVDSAWRSGWIEIFEPTRLELGPGLSPAAALVHSPGTEDWRLSHIVGDELRELDPVLFWRSIAKPPYNAQRFKGPLAAVPKPPDVFRVLAYGDSNTDGPPDGAPWPAFLQGAIRARPDLQARTCEVLNAGVAGYSSYQGLLRARQELATYAPDLLLVSFGWNDLPAAIGRPDKEFEPPSAAYVRALDLLARSKLFLLLKRLAEDPAPARSPGPRVSPEDYDRNLSAFLELARENGVGIAFLTRPHRLTTAEQRALPGWRGHVPEYNDVVRAFAARTGAALIDVAGRFEGRASDFYDESHFSERGHVAMARFLLGRLEELGLLDALRER